MTRPIESRQLRELLSADAELALMDVREQGVHYRGHPFFACSLPLSRLELMAPALMPRKDVTVVLLDGGDEGLSERAAASLASAGYTDLRVLSGGCAGWKAAGGELFSGINVPSKAFGEFVEHHHDTPRVPPDAIRRMVEGGRNMVILDSRPYEEFHRMNIPGAVNVPGAELVYRVHDLAPDPATLVVVNCAGRTRSIIGCQSLRNAGVRNEVVALKDGTMGWELAGFECERGSTRVAPPPSPAGLARARAAAMLAAKRFRVRFATGTEVRNWQSDVRRTLFLLDVRTRDEYEACRIAASQHAPGGQLVQATDEFIGVRNARIVLIDPQRVRSVMTASWLNQMGWDDVHVLEPEGEDGFAGWETSSGPQAVALALPAMWPASISVLTLADRLATGNTLLLDLSSSLRYRARHVAGAWWAVRSRLEQASAKCPVAAEIVLTGDDPALVRWAAPDIAARWPGVPVRILEGGNAAWFAAGLPVESGLARATTATDDIWYKPYEHEHGTDFEKHARAYLEWEVALVEQMRHDPTIRFRAD